MREQYGGQLTEVAMTERWKQWEGQTVNEEFRLAEYLGGSDDSPVFKTTYSDPPHSAAAIKFVSENSANAQKRLESWQLASKLSHPNLIQLLQTGRCQIGDAKLLYAVMEFAEENLSQIIPHRPLTEAEAREMLRPTLDALADLHAKGLVHGRIKPANIMASGNQLKLSTDGLRRAGEPISERGNYDPPETISSSAGDVWSFGMTLVEALTQRLPEWDRKEQGDPDVPKALPGPFLEIARNCLRRDPSFRWAIGDIANCLTTPVAAVWKEQTAQQRSIPRRSQYSVPVLILLLVLAALVTITWLDYFSKRSVKLSQTSERPLPKTLPEAAPTGSAAPSQAKATLGSEPEGGSRTSQVTSAAPPSEASETTEPKSASSGVIHQVLPDVPQKARDTIHGAVRVSIKVTVDGAGKVIDAKIASPGPSRYFANLALQAARLWKFTATRDTSKQWTLLFEFSAGGTNASARQTRL